MNVIISESQFKVICEQHGFAGQGAPDWYMKNVDAFKKKDEIKLLQTISVCGTAQ